MWFNTIMIVRTPRIYWDERIYWFSMLDIKTVFYTFINNTLTTYPDGRRVAGQSYVTNPNGDLIFQAGEEEGVFELDLDLSQIDEIRKRWPYLSDIEKRRFTFQIKPIKQ